MSKQAPGANAPKRDLSRLADAGPLSPEASAKGGLSSEVQAPKANTTPQTLTPRTIRFSEEDEAEIDRIDEYLRERGLKRTDATKIIRLALKVAFRDVSDEDLRQYHQEIQIKHARGKKPIL